MPLLDRQIMSFDWSSGNVSGRGGIAGVLGGELVVSLQTIFERLYFLPHICKHGHEMCGAKVRVEEGSGRYWAI